METAGYAVGAGHRAVHILPIFSEVHKHPTILLFSGDELI